MCASMRSSGASCLQEGEILVETGHGDPRPFIVETREGSMRAWVRGFWSSVKKKAHA